MIPRYLSDASSAEYTVAVDEITPTPSPHSDLSIINGIGLVMNTIARPNTNA